MKRYRLLDVVSLLYKGFGVAFLLAGTMCLASGITMIVIKNSEVTFTGVHLISGSFIFFAGSLALFTSSQTIQLLIEVANDVKAIKEMSNYQLGRGREEEV